MTKLHIIDFDWFIVYIVLIWIRSISQVVMSQSLSVFGFVKYFWVLSCKKKKTSVAEMLWWNILREKQERFEVKTINNGSKIEIFF